jgi:hypothetical protein
MQMRERSNRTGRAEWCLRAGVLLATLTAALGGACGASARSKAHPLRTCPLPSYPGLGYFTSLSVSGTTCATGKKVAIAYYHCRIKHGGVKGRCPGGVLGFHCSVVSDSIPTEIDARVTCTYKHETVVHTYQQDT